MLGGGGRRIIWEMLTQTHNNCSSARDTLIQKENCVFTFKGRKCQEKEYMRALGGKILVFFPSEALCEVWIMHMTS